MTQELLLCPFCGGGAEWSKGRNGDGSDWDYIACSICEALAPYGDDQVKAWNTRAQPKYKRVDLDEFLLFGQNDYCDGNNKAIELIKSKYGDLYVEVK